MLIRISVTSKQCVLLVLAFRLESLHFSKYHDELMLTYFRWMLQLQGIIQSIDKKSINFFNYYNVNYVKKGLISWEKINFPKKIHLLYFLVLLYTAEDEVNSKLVPW